MKVLYALFLLICSDIILGQNTLPLFCTISYDSTNVYSRSVLAEFKYFGASRDGDDYDIVNLFVDRNSIANITATYKICGDLGASVVAGIGSPVFSPWIPEAINYPGTQWANIASVPSFGAVLSPPNTHWSVPWEWYIEYIKGYTAGIMSESGSIALIFPFSSVSQFVRQSNAFYMGAKSANPDIKYYSIYLGGYLSNLVESAVNKLLAIDPQIDVFGHIMGTLALQDYVLNNPSLDNVWIIENFISFKLTEEEIKEVIGNERVLTATKTDYQPILNEYADLFINGELEERTLIFRNEWGNHEIVMDVSHFSDAIPNDKLNEIKKVYKSVVEKNKNPFCGKQAVELLGPVYQLVNNCLSEYDTLTGLNFIQGTAPIPL